MKIEVEIVKEAGERGGGRRKGRAGKTLNHKATGGYASKHGQVRSVERPCQFCNPRYKEYFGNMQSGEPCAVSTRGPVNQLACRDPCFG